jgi:high-affinity nickel-transport protein
VLSGELNLSGIFWSWINSLDFETMGYGIILLFVLSWLVSVAIYKFKKIETVSFQQHSRLDGIPDTM